MEGRVTLNNRVRQRLARLGKYLPVIFREGAAEKIGLSIRVAVVPGTTITPRLTHTSPTLTLSPAGLLNILY
jgi:hypothetical protein